MNTKQLRQKILDLAIRGKLVPQDPNDEPASVLLERIRAEKERLIKEKKIKPDKKKNDAKSHYGKEVPFEVPDSWEWAIISDISTSIQYGYTGKAISEGKYKMLRITDIQNNSVDWASVPFVEIEDNKAKDYLLFDSNILFARTGATVGKSFLIENLDEKSVFASYLIRINTSNNINARYLNHFLDSDFYWKQIMERSIGTGQPNVNGTILGELKIPIPPYVEQQRIVNEIENQYKWIFIIDESKQVLDELIQHSKSKILDLAIRGKLVPQDPNDEPVSVLLEQIRKKQKLPKKTADKFHYPFGVPESWEWTRFSNIVQHNSGKTLDKSRNTGKMKEYITTSNLFWGRFELTELRTMPIEEKELSKCTAVKGDLLICEGGDAGRSAIWNLDHSICFQNHVHRVRPLDGSISTKYLYYYMLYIYLNGDIKQYLKGVGIQSLSGSSLSSITIPLPPYPEQQRIVEKIEGIFKMLDKIEENMQTNA